MNLTSKSSNKKLIQTPLNLDWAVLGQDTTRSPRYVHTSQKSTFKTWTSPKSAVRLSEIKSMKARRKYNHKISSIISNCTNLEDPYNTLPRQIDSVLKNEQQKCCDFSNTVYLLQKYNEWDPLNLQRHVEWNLLSQKEEADVAKTVTREFKTGIWDPSRPVAVIERSISLYKKEKNRQMIEKIRLGLPIHLIFDKKKLRRK